MKQEILDLINRRYFTDEDIQPLGSEAVPALIALFAEPTDDKTGTWQQAIVHMLGVLNGEQAVAFLKTIYHQAEGQDETMQMAALSALARTDHVSALALVLPLLESEQKRTRKNAIVGLRGTKRLEVLAAIRERVQSDPDPALRKYAERVATEIEERLKKD